MRLSRFRWLVCGVSVLFDLHPNQKWEKTSRFEVPDDGYPCLEDWMGCFESMLLSGPELGREPLDTSATPAAAGGFSQKTTMSK